MQTNSLPAFQAATAHCSTHPAETPFPDLSCACLWSVKALRSVHERTFYTQSPLELEGNDSYITHGDDIMMSCSLVTRPPGHSCAVVFLNLHAGLCTDSC